MKDEMKTALETAMDEFDRKRSDAAKRQEATKTKETEFSRSVERLFNEVIRPAMEEVERSPAHCCSAPAKGPGNDGLRYAGAKCAVSRWPPPYSGCRVRPLPDALASGSHGRTTERRTRRPASQVHRARKGVP